MSYCNSSKKKKNIATATTAIKWQQHHAISATINSNKIGNGRPASTCHFHLNKKIIEKRFYNFWVATPTTTTTAPHVLLDTKSRSLNEPQQKSGSFLLWDLIQK